MTNLAVKVEAGASPVDCARDLLKEHMKVNIRTRPASDGSRRESCLLYTSDAADDTPCVDL
eukprot:282577-Pyramimonas_sp.AAC.1